MPTASSLASAVPHRKSVRNPSLSISSGGLDRITDLTGLEPRRYMAICDLERARNRFLRCKGEIGGVLERCTRRRMAQWLGFSRMLSKVASEKLPTNTCGRPSGSGGILPHGRPDLSACLKINCRLLLRWGRSTRVFSSPRRIKCEGDKKQAPGRAQDCSRWCRPPMTSHLSLLPWVGFLGCFFAPFFAGRGGKSKPIFAAAVSKVRWASNLRFVRFHESFEQIRFALGDEFHRLVFGDLALKRVWFSRCGLRADLSS